MKDFAKDYAEPIATVIWAFHTPIKETHIKDYLKCDAVFQDNHNPNEILLARKADDFYCTHPMDHELMSAIGKWCKAAETYKDELVEWQYAEYQRVMNAVRDVLIEWFENGKE